MNNAGCQDGGLKGANLQKKGLSGRQQLAVTMV
jgi:hypothetical protein